MKFLVIQAIALAVLASAQPSDPPADQPVPKKQWYPRRREETATPDGEDETVLGTEFWCRIWPGRDPKKESAKTYDDCIDAREPEPIHPWVPKAHICKANQLLAEVCMGTKDYCNSPTARSWEFFLDEQECLDSREPEPVDS